MASLGDWMYLILFFLGFAKGLGYGILIGKRRKKKKDGRDNVLGKKRDKSMPMASNYPGKNIFE